MDLTPLYRCSKCDERKPLAEFPPSKAHNASQWCRQCLRTDARRRLGLIAADRTIACGYCGKSADVSDSRAMYCSRHCKELARNRKRQDAIDAAKPDRKCQWCGEPMPQSMRSDAKFCSADCNSSAHKQTRNYRRRMGAAAPARPRKAPLVNFSVIAERDGWKCHLCGKKVSKSRKHPDPLCASLDHLVPVSLGGTNDPSNLRLSHLRCNTSKRADARGEQLLLL